MRVSLTWCLMFVLGCIVALCVANACVRPNTIDCGSEICPAGSVCSTDGTCVLPSDWAPTVIVGQDVAASETALGNPSSIAFDSKGRVYFSDPFNHRIRRIDLNTDGSVQSIVTVVGNGNPGFEGDGGPATKARLLFPYSIAIDARDQLYIADFGNNRIRVVDRDKNIRTIAGNGDQVYTSDGVAAITTGMKPYAIAFDQDSQNVYFSDVSNHRVRVVNSQTGVIATVAGDGVTGGPAPSTWGDNGLATLAHLYQPAGLQISQGALYVAEYGHHSVRKVLLDSNVISTIAGDGATELLNHPRSIALYQDQLYIADTSNNRVQKLNGTTLETFIGTGVANFSGDVARQKMHSLHHPGQSALIQLDDYTSPTL
jgi:trimeric autotransporter adhesin